MAGLKFHLLRVRIYIYIDLGEVEMLFSPLNLNKMRILYYYDI